MGDEPKPFTGEATALMAAVRASDGTANSLPPAQLISRFKACVDAISSAVKRCAGTTLLVQGDTTVAYWTSEHHAQAAFDAACEIVNAPRARGLKGFEIRVALGTGELGGDYFGTRRQFQIVGKAMAIIDRIMKMKATGGSFVRMSQYTVQRIATSERLREDGEIERDGLEPLKVYALVGPAN